jgi:hypothetical protein
VTDDQFLAWTAGFFDGEGCVSVESRGSLLSISVCQQSEECLRLLKRRFGGAINSESKPKPNVTLKNGDHVVWRWRLWGSSAYTFIRKIEPYSIVKKDQLKVALTWPTPYTNYRGILIPSRVKEQRLFIMHELRRIRKAGKVLVEAPNAE